MEKEFENLDSSNEKNDFDVDTTEDIVVLKEEYKKVIDKNKRLFERTKKSEGELKEIKAKPELEKKPEGKKDLVKSGELDYSQLAFLAAKGVEADDELELAREVIVESGKELKEVLKTNYFQARLKELRDAKAAQAAMPLSSGRGNAPARDSLDYALAKYEQKGELPPRDQVELRRKVINARLEKETNKNKFSSDPLVQ